MSDLSLTLQQQDSVERIYARICQDAEVNGETPASWEAFQKEIQPTFGMDGAVVVPFAGMFLAVETDGYTHS